MLSRVIGVLIIAAGCAPFGLVAAETKIDLAQGWLVQSSAKVTSPGEEIASERYRPQDWYRCTVPTTVVNALVNNQVYADPYFGMNLRLIPGTTYGIGMNFSNMAMPADSPFARSWWYRTQFRLPAATRGKNLWLNFDAINYRANIWLNGQKIADAEHAAGMYRMFEFDVTKNVLVDAVNTLAVEVFAPTQNEFTITYVDWNPMPADKDMGLVRDVYIRASGPVTVRHTQVVSKLEPGGGASVRLSAYVRNATERAIEGTLRGTIGEIAVTKKVRLGAREFSRIEFTPEEFPKLKMAHPKLWWPYGLGAQDLYRAHVEFDAGGQVSDEQDVEFGIREVTSVVDEQGHRLFRINGKNILIRGGGWSSDMFLRFSPEREEDEIRYTRDMHLNTIRLEGKMMNDHFFETCDRYGVMVMAGWCCCSYWERWRNWKPEDYTVAGESLRDQIRRIQNHPSILTWLYGSDNSPTAQAESVYLKVLREEHWPNPYISSAAKATTEGAGPTGVKMTGPYDYVAPNYWLQDQQHGGAFGFNTETSPGPAIPVLASLTEMLPKEHLWPIDEYWNFHAGGGSYRNVNLFNAALEGRYGKATGLEDYVMKSQVMAYEGERAMFEAFGRNKYKSTGVVQWMLNNAWPSIIWHLYDYYLRPGGGYFGTKKACEPLHVQYSYDDRSVAVVNSYYREFAHHRVTAKIYDLNLTERFARTQEVDIGPDSAVRVFDLPEADTTSTTYFVRLSLSDAAGKVVSSNFYWLSRHPDVSDFAKSNGRYTPIQSYADLTELQRLAAAKVTVDSRLESTGNEEVAHLVVQNPTQQLAFFVHLRVLKGPGGQEIAPVLWEDNYFELMPGERREITASYRKALLGPSRATFEVDGWNVAAR